MEKQMLEDISELKVNQALLVQRQEQTDEVIEDLRVTIKDMKNALDKVTKVGYIFLGMYLATSLGAGDVIKVLFKTLGG